MWQERGGGNMQQKGGIKPRTAAKDSALCALGETLYQVPLLVPSCPVLCIFSIWNRTDSEVITIQITFSIWWVRELVKDDWQIALSEPPRNAIEHQLHGSM